MAHMTDEEAKRLDEKWTKNPPKPGPNGTGYFTKCNQSAYTVTIDKVTANYLNTKGNIIIVSNTTVAYLRVKAESVHKTPSELVDEMIQEQIAAAV